MWPFNKRKLGFKEKTLLGDIETIKLHYMNERNYLKYSCICDVLIPDKYNKKLSDFLKDSKSLKVYNVEQEDGRKYSKMTLNSNNIIYICLNSRFEHKIKEVHPMEFTLFGYGKDHQGYARVEGEVILTKKGGLESKLNNAPFIPVRNFKILRKKEKYPVGFIFMNYIFDSKPK